MYLYYDIYEVHSKIYKWINYYLAVRKVFLFHTTRSISTVVYSREEKNIFANIQFPKGIVQIKRVSFIHSIQCVDQISPQQRWLFFILMHNLFVLTANTWHGPRRCAFKWTPVNLINFKVQTDKVNIFFDRKLFSVLWQSTRILDSKCYFDGWIWILVLLLVD